jgi:hypothetical protein
VVGEHAAVWVDAIPRSHRSDLLEFLVHADVLDMRTVRYRTRLNEILFSQASHAGSSEAVGDRLPCSIGAIRSGGRYVPG